MEDMAAEEEVEVRIVIVQVMLVAALVALD